MTKTIQINCDKWKKIIGIVLWSGASIGLGIALYIGYDQAFNGYHPDCDKRLPDNWYKSCLQQAYKDPFVLEISSVANIGNYIGIWIVTNKHYKWFEVKCATNSENGST